MAAGRRRVRPGRRAYRQDELVVLPPIEVPLDAEHEQRALIALADLLAPLFITESLTSGDSEGPRDGATAPRAGAVSSPSLGTAHDLDSRR
ncbi:MAG: hypothetical protein M0014_07935 [Actinomycetota bacterium]|nr:hypothetical protein [Actinomycetota bacterium]